MAYNDHNPSNFEIGKYYQVVKPEGIYSGDYPDGEDGSRMTWTYALEDAQGKIFECVTAFYNGRHAFLSGCGNVGIHINWVKGPYDTQEQAELSQKIKIQKTVKGSNSNDVHRIDRAVELVNEFAHPFTQWELNFVDSLDRNYRHVELSYKQRNCLDKILAKGTKEIKIEPLSCNPSNDVEDIKYFQKQLSNTLKIPKKLLEDYSSNYQPLVQNFGERPYIKSREWQKNAKKIVDDGFDYQKHRNDNGNPYVQGELCGIEEITDLSGDEAIKKVVTKWKDPATGIVTTHTEKCEEVGLWGKKTSQHDLTDPYNPCGEVTMCNLQEVVIPCVPLAVAAVDDNSDDTRSTQEQIKDADKECWRGIEKVEAERNLRDQKRRWRRERERIKTETPTRKAHWGWTAATILVFAGIVSAVVGGAVYVGSLPCDLDPQRTNVEFFNDLLDRR